jgi:hypothetical protein
MIQTEDLLYLFIYSALQFHLILTHLVKIQFHISDLRRFRRGINVSLSWCGLSAVWHQVHGILRQRCIDFSRSFLTSFSSSAIFLFFAVATEAGVAGFLVAVFGLLADPASTGVFTVVPIDILAFLAVGALELIAQSGQIREYKPCYGDSISVFVLATSVLHSFLR